VSVRKSKKHVRKETREEYMRRMRPWVIWMIQKCAQAREI
jgi:hypothetical protein